ncbi:MAG: insulinase family protein, partial [Planctomycetes bacterium]|nr:insulinase family protein [Planctomycetota bacterium]
DNYPIPASGQNPFPTTDYSGLTYTRAKGDTFDRSKQPEPGASPLVKVPDFWSTTLDNGLKVIGTRTDEIPIVAVQLTLNGGHKLDAYDPAKSGLAELTAALMNESTENYTSEEVQEALRKLGSNISVYASGARTTMSITTLKKHLVKTLEIAEDVLSRPKFTQDDYDRVKKQQLEGVLSMQKDATAIADIVFNRLLYGDGHIYAVPSSGTEASLTSITPDDVKAFYKSYYAPDVSELVVVGDISRNEIMPLLGFLQTWKSKAVKIPDLPDAPGTGQTRLYLVDKPEAPQSEIRIGYVTDMPYDATGEYFKCTLMNYPLGGAFNSRINLNLREDKGWTYGARSNFGSDDDPGPYVAQAGVKGAATDGAVFEFMKEIKAYRDKGITDEEVSFIRKSIGQRDARNYETPGQKASFLRRIVHYNLDKTYVDDQAKIINAITREEITGLAKKHLRDKNMYILVVGDKASHLEGLQKLGYDIVELDVKGQVVPDDTTK